MKPTASESMQNNAPAPRPWKRGLLPCTSMTPGPQPTAASSAFAGSFGDDKLAIPAVGLSFDDPERGEAKYEEVAG